MRARTSIAAVVIALLAPQAAAGAAPPYAVSDPLQVAVRMSDGTVLAADVYRPLDARNGTPARGPFPVILSITPYGKRSAVTTSSAGGGLGGDGHYPYLVRRGYLNVVVDVRGTGASDGHFGLFDARERRDGVELARWAARLPGASGRVGMAGCSYLGLNQIFTAAGAGPRSPVRAIVPCAAGIDLYRDLAFGGGIPNVEFAGVWLALRGTMVGSDPARAGARALDLARGEASMYGEIELDGERAFDGPFWRERAPARYLARVVENGVPAMLLSGWFDVYQRGVVLDYAALQNAYAGLRGASVLGPMPAGARPSGRYQAVIGPWFHNSTGSGIAVQRLLLRWFDRWLKGVRNGVDRTRTPLHAYELRGGGWLDAGRYPLPAARVRRMWLGAGRTGSAAASLNDGALASRAPRVRGSDAIAWSDATSPCNRASDQWNTGLGEYATATAGMPASPCWSDDRSSQAGALTYTTPPFRRAATLAGPVDATLFVRSSTRDAELVVSVEDVSPGGDSYPLTSGALLASHRALDRSRSWRGPGGGTILPYHPYTRGARRYLSPGDTARLEVEVLPVFARIARGHRLRVTVATAATHLHPTAAQARELAGGRYEIVRGGGRGSFVNLPLLDPAG